MTGRRSAIVAVKCLFAVSMILVSLLSLCNAKISDKRLCYDKACSVVISKGKTVIPYNSKDYDVLSFPVNTDVKIFSKQAGNRQDLWGVEIEGKRGYAPSKFIREMKVLHTKLEYIVPTKESDNKEVIDIVKKMEKLDESDYENQSSNKMESHNKIMLPEDVLKTNFEEAIIPHQVSPSYESVYDGTLLPQENEEESPTPSYSTQILENSIKEDEQVQLNVYPNLISSTFPTLSDIWNDIEEGSEGQDNEDVSSENINDAINDKVNGEVNGEVNSEKVLDIEETDKSSLVSKQNQDILSENLVLDYTIEGVSNNKILSEDVNEINNNNKTDLLVQDKVNNTDLLIQNKENETDSLVEDDVNETDSLIEHEVNTTSDENIISVKDDTIQDDEKIESQVVNINAEEKLANNVEVIDSVNNEDNVEVQSSPLENISTDESSLIEKIKSIFEDLQNDIVPKQDETVIVTNNSISDESHTSASVHNAEFRLEKQEVVNTTSVDSMNVTDSTISEVPLKQDVDEESITSSDEFSLPSEELIQTNFLKNENEEKKVSVDISDNSTTHNLLTEELSVDNLIHSETQFEVNDNIINSNNNVTDNNTNVVNEAINPQNNVAVSNLESNFQSVDSNHKHIVDIPSTSSFGEFLGNRNLLNAKKEPEEVQLEKVLNDDNTETTISFEADENFSSEIKQEEEKVSFEETPSIKSIEKKVLTLETCDKNYECSEDDKKYQYKADENAVINMREIRNSSETLLYVCIMAVTTLLFSLGYYLIENKRRDSYLISKINNLEKELMVAKKECIMLDENFKSTKAKLDSIEDQSFGSNEMVLSLKAELAASENTRVELEDQIVSLEKELESTSEAGLELECMLREILSSHNDENNPLAKSIEDLQDRLNDQQVANESLTNALTIKTRENETLSEDHKLSLKKVEELQTENTKLIDELKVQMNTRIDLEQTLSEQVQKLELQVNTLTEDKSLLRKKLRIKELEVKEFKQVIEKMNTNTLDFEKLYEISHIKAEAVRLLEERDELKIKLHEEEGTHQLLEEHIKVISDEVAFLSEKCKVSEKDKKDAETRLEVLTKFFEEKETQRQKEEAIWLEKQGEVSSTVDRLQTMQNEILNYKQQIEMLKREILDQEREYKSQISVLETKAHEQWVAARQNERRLEEVKVESSQLRNRLTLVEKNMNDGDTEIKLHRLQNANGETHPLFAAPETSSSPLMFGASGPAPPPPPPGSFLYGPASFAPPPPFLPPPPLAGSRPPPLGGGRLSSPPPGNGGSATNSSSNAGNEPGVNPATGPGLPLSPPPPLMPFPHHPLHRHRSPPPLPPFASDVPPPPPPPGSLLHPHHLHRHMPLPPPLHPHQQEQHHQQYPGVMHQPWADEAPLPMRNSSGFHIQQRDQRVARNHKGSLHSSGESLDKSYHGGKA